MKINITSDPSKSISGYKNYFTYNNDSLDLSDVVPNCCSEILLTGLDYVSQSKIDDVLNQAISKLRVGGKLLISGLNLDTFVRNVLSEQMSEKEASHLIENIKSVRSRLSITKSIQNRNLLVEYSISKGNIYELSAIRK